MRTLFADMANQLRRRFETALGHMCNTYSRFFSGEYAFDMRNCPDAQCINIDEIAFVNLKWRAVDPDGYYSDFSNIDLQTQGYLIDWIEKSLYGKCGNPRI